MYVLGPGINFIEHLASATLYTKMQIAAMDSGSIKLKLSSQLDIEAVRS
jgi:hypothetical protein